jgi:hypothetical protein
MAFVTLMTEACQCAEKELMVHFIFDRNHVEEPRAVQTFTDIKDGQRNPLWRKLGRLTFADRKAEIGLQAADLYTYLWYSYLEHDTNITLERAQILQILTRRRREIRIWGEEGMKKLLDTLSPRQREKLQEKNP